MKNKQLYICSECGHSSAKWNGQCPSCKSWGSISLDDGGTLQGDTAAIAVARTAKKLNIKNIEEVDMTADARVDTGTAEFNRVLGGGLTAGSVVLIAGEPGIGKSTLLLQLCGNMRGNVLYVSGEESEKQIKMRARRLGIDGGIMLISTTDCDGVIATVYDGGGLTRRGSGKTDSSGKSAVSVRGAGFSAIIIDSIQTMRTETAAGTAGSVTQVRECTNMLTRLAKSADIPIIIVGHVTKDGSIAGPKILEHIVDTVLYFEGDGNYVYRVLRSVKNRFGKANELGIFEMGARGLIEVPNPTLLSSRAGEFSGTCVFAASEGSRRFLIEVQALVTKTNFGNPRRTADGFDYNRLCLIIAVLEKRTGYVFGGCDVYVNIAGGIRINEPAADLAVAAALWSSLLDKPLPPGLFVFGEIGLGGELRPVPQTEDRLDEGARMGFTVCITHGVGISREINGGGGKTLKVVNADNINTALQIFEKTVDKNRK